MPVWKELLKLGKSTRGDDAVSAMFDEIIKIRPDLKGALNYIKGEYKIGNISGEAAKRAANMTERSARASGAGLDRTGVKTLADYGTARASAHESMSSPAFERIDERIQDFDLKGDKAVDAKERNSRGQDAFHADVVNDDYKFFDKEAYKDFDDAIAERFDKLNNDAGGLSRYLDSFENEPIEHYRNAIKSGLSQQDAIESTRRYMEQQQGRDMDFKGVTEYLRLNGAID